MAQPAQTPALPDNHDALDEAVATLHSARDDWARLGTPERIALLEEIKDCLMPVAEGWAETAARHKLIPAGSPLVGEEWISGPYALMSACNGLIETLSNLDGKTFLTSLQKRTTATGQLAVKVLPHTIWERLLLSGIKAEVWMEPGVSAATLPSHTATAYDTPPAQRRGKLALVLGAGNINAISPLDVFQKLFSEHQVVVLKMNPVNDYLTEYLEAALRPLIARNALRIVTGGADVGAYLCHHPQVEEIHITGAAASHDVIVWGPGAEGAANKAAGTPKLTKPITSELGAVCPTIVVPGPWSAADLRFQAEHLATQKLHNSGFNCIACQMLILPQAWEGKDKLLANLNDVMASHAQRQPWYPGARDRMAEFARRGDNVTTLDRGAAPACAVVPVDDTSDDWFRENEIFAPVLSTHEIAETDPESYLRAAIRYANDELHGTLGGNILIHPATMKQIGRKRFEEIIAEFHYGTVAINAWTGLGFLLTACPWGAYPGHTLADVGSGIGFAHNTFMFDKAQRVVVQAPWQPFPRNILSGGRSLLPRPPWFITNRRQDRIGKLLTRFQYKPGWLKLPRIFLNALLG
ncbi:aldehyde dehydrogenase family protein [Rhodalgimonas zhirmunskyi]|uniref:Aldehyde dehydrogenase family protein n=1 Tax=Rhodalgimonas zhirmunskyi TaxID=2964767 RepID=A0AAJ1U8D5_9RHOB|nr:aldehyde dehydrogenase family protein [Rhodoalgimonas zhirmunskyi]MDQ2093660.1 aldehyde dehydrogenase family protein [Rhodoalgimonas zhirmunskyi]